MPEGPFPSGNTPADFNAKMGMIMAQRIRRGHIKLAVLGGSVAVGLAFAIGLVLH